MSDTIYTTITGQEPIGTYGDLFIEDSHCYVCSRHTDHFAEHDSLVTLGLAEYGPHGDVYVTDFARTPHGEYLRHWYDVAITAAMYCSGVCLIKPEGYAITRALQFGFLIPGREGR